MKFFNSKNDITQKFCSCQEKILPFFKEFQKGF